MPVRPTRWTNWKIACEAKIDEPSSRDWPTGVSSSGSTTTSVNSVVPEADSR